MDPVTFIHQEMMTNARGPHVAYMRNLLRVTWVDALVPAKQSVDFGLALRRWYSLVRNGQAWDYKKTIIQLFGRWMDDPSSSLRYGHDLWANLHYGYIGLACGFDRWTLLQGAGFAQVFAGTSPEGYWERRLDTFGDADLLAAFDDPKDQEAIRAGFSLWEGHGTLVQPPHIWSEIRSRAKKLSTSPKGAVARAGP